MTTFIIFGLLSIPLAILSRRSFTGLKNHGLYRFFAWECILWIALANRNHMMVEQFDVQQMTASILMLIALLLVISAVWLLFKTGQPDERRGDRTLLAFEKTTVLIETGVFRYIRHPMYSSLLFLMWGLLLRDVTLPLVLVALTGTLLCVVAARIEEKENLAYFGERYQDYMLRTKRFIHFVI